VATALTSNSINGPSDIAFSSALIYAGIPAHPEGHDVLVQSVRVYCISEVNPMNPGAISPCGALTD